MKPGKNDRQLEVLITGAELRELKRLDHAESFGLRIVGASYMRGSAPSACINGISIVCSWWDRWRPAAVIGLCHPRAG